MRHTPVAASVTLTLALLLLLVPSASAERVTTLRADGTTVTRDDPLIPAPGAAGPARTPLERAQSAPPTGGATPSVLAPLAPLPAEAPAPKGSVTRALDTLLASGQIDRALHNTAIATYRDATRLRKKLSGTRRGALGAVIDNFSAVARSGRLTRSMLPGHIETLRRNRQYWANSPLLANGRRVMFSGSELVWQYYAGEGLQIQWLGTFGRANGLWQVKNRTKLKILLDEALALATQRAGGISFDSLFDFGGGKPPWASGLGQGTGLQALSRGYALLGDPRYLEGARRALGIFRTAAPAGVTQQANGGVHFLIYSYAPQLRVLNGFTQALNGLHEYALITGDVEGRRLFALGETALRAELPAYDTGGWSRYSNQRDSDVGYHSLVRDFLRSLCKRLTDDLARPAGAIKPGTDPALYCSTARNFTEYLKDGPDMRLVSTRVRAGKAASVRFALDKPSTVTMRITRGGSTVTTLRAYLGTGTRSLRWNRPRTPGDYKVSLSARDLTGVSGNASGTLQVLQAK